MQCKIGKMISDGGAIKIKCGFVPDFVLMIARGASDGNAIIYTAFPKLMADLGTPFDGWALTDGVDAEVASGSGIAEYDTASQGPTINTWSEDNANAAVARTATTPGTYIRPATASKGNLNAVFECITAGTSSATEPTWPVEDGGTVLDGTVEFERVVVPTQKKGYQGFSLPASLTGFADGNEGWFIAIEGDICEDMGDVTGWVSGIEDN